MAAKRGDVGSRAINAVAGMAAAFVARKLLTFAWTKVTGKQPPEHPEDPQTALSEALIWGIMVGAGVSTARLLATRLTSRNAITAEDEPPVAD
jgi:hypothetical protein